MKKKLQIKLKSDLCAGSGESLGSLIDTDICYDCFGLAYIPSKRLKGLLKEAFIEYFDWAKNENNTELFDKINKNLFGVENSNNSSNLKIDNAYLENTDLIEDEIQNIENRYRKYLTKQRIINLNTDIRYQTAVAINSGVAKENSLRNIRIIEAGNNFEAVLECDTEEELQILEKCVKLVTHMGNNRTRGLGEIECRLLDMEEENQENVTYKFEPEKEYEIKLILKAESNIMVSKQFSEITENYIPGSNIMGSFASKYIKDNNINDFENLTDEYINLFLNGNVKYSNAYITEKDGYVQYYPAPLSYSKVKNKSKVYHNKMFDVNETDIQLSDFGDKFVTLDENNYVKEVETIEHYHHQRAKDLSMGHVSTGTDGGTFYQFLSIEKGQYFLTSINGKGKYLDKLSKYLKENEILRVGKSKTAEYGKLKITNTKISEYIEKRKKYNKFAVILTSALILLDEENVQIAKDKETLIKTLKKLFKNENLKDVKSFIGYTEESGFNAIWNLPKEQVVSYSAGTTIVFESPESVELKEKYIIGERTNEGYGQLIIYSLDGKNDSTLNLNEYIQNEKEIEYSKLNKETRKLLNKSIKKVINEEIIENAFDTVKSNYNRVNINNTTIGRILLMLKESNNYADFDENVKGIKDVKKLDNIIKIIENKDRLYSLQAYKDYEDGLKTIAGVIQESEKEKFILEYIKQFFTILKIMGGKE